MPTAVEKEDNAALARLDTVEAPPEAEGQTSAFGGQEKADRGDAPPEAFVLMATLVSHGGSGGSGSGGAKANMKFEVHEEDLAELIANHVIGRQAFDVTFDKASFGDGLTIGGYSGRPDEDGGARSWIVLVVPENQQTKLASIYSRHLLQKHGRLLLEPAQVTLDEILTAKAE